MSPQQRVWRRRLRRPRAASDRLLDGLAIMTTDGYTAGAPLLKRAVTAFCDSEFQPTKSPSCCHSCARWRRRCGTTRAGCGCPTGWSRPLATWARSARFLSASYRRPCCRCSPATSPPRERLVAEAEAIARVIGRPVARYGSLAIAAWTGREAEVTQPIAASMDEMIDARRRSVAERRRVGERGPLQRSRPLSTRRPSPHSGRARSISSSVGRPGRLLS